MWNRLGRNCSFCRLHTAISEEGEKDCGTELGGKGSGRDDNSKTQEERPFSFTNMNKDHFPSQTLQCGQFWHLIFFTKIDFTILVRNTQFT